MKIPEGKFGCILADPPWNFKTYDGKKSVPTQGVDPYSTLSLDALKLLPISEICAPSCALIMWHSGTHTDQAIELASAWGFRFIRSELFVWVKAQENRKPDLGMGYYSRNGAEIAGLFITGKPKVRAHDIEQVIFSPRRAHSRKPDEQYDRINRLFGGPYLELFARRQRKNWRTWGDDTEKFDSIEGDLFKDLDA